MWQRDWTKTTATVPLHGGLIKGIGLLSQGLWVRVLSGLERTGCWVLELSQEGGKMGDGVCLLLVYLLRGKKQINASFVEVVQMQVN